MSLNTLKVAMADPQKFMLWVIQGWLTQPSCAIRYRAAKYGPTKTTNFIRVSFDFHHHPAGQLRQKHLKVSVGLICNFAQMILITG